MRLLLAALTVLLLTLPASAQTEGDVSTRVTPETLTIDYSKYIPAGQGEGQSITVHVTGSIECLPGSSAPFDVFIEANGTTAQRGTAGGETTTYMELAMTNFTVPWEAQPDGTTYTIDAMQEIPIIVEGAPIVELTSTINWAGQQLDSQPGTRCDPFAYGWTVDATPHTIIVPAVGGGPGDDNGDKEEKKTPGLGVAALVGALGVALARRR